MSTPELPSQGAANGPPAKKSKTWIIVLIIVAAILIPAICVCGGALSVFVLRMKGVQSHGQLIQAGAEIALLDNALSFYELDMGEFPSTEQGLLALSERPTDSPQWAGPYLEEGIPFDPWGNEYQYELIDSNTYRIWSPGPDGVSGTDDDVDNTVDNR